MKFTKNFRFLSFLILGIFFLNSGPGMASKLLLEELSFGSKNLFKKSLPPIRTVPFFTQKSFYSSFKGKGLAFYIQAHQDDWQLFRGKSAFNDISDKNNSNNYNNKVVFIYTTAGDGGRGDGCWEAREFAAMNSIRAVLPSQPVNLKIMNVNNHPLVRYTCNNTVSYFMRLPDGGDGAGYPATGNISLKKLMTESVYIRAVDNSTQYENWDDFRSTLKAILDSEKCERLSSTIPWINVADYDPKENPGDHYDHHYTSLAVKDFSPYNFAYYLTYCTKDKAPNLQGDPLANKQKTFEGYKISYIDEMVKNGANREEYESGCNKEWQEWGDKNYFREVTQ